MIPKRTIMNRITALLLTLTVSAAMICFVPAEASAKSKKTKAPAWAKGKIVAHAGGGVAGTAYTNSVEALTETLNKNVKCVEIDFAWSADHRLVCAHKSTDFRFYTPTAEQFVQKDPNLPYTHMDAATALQMLCERGDVYMIMDTQEKKPERVYAEIKTILESSGHGAYMKKIVPQLYGESQYKKFRKVYKFRSGIFTLYKVKPLTRSKLRKIARFCKKKKLVVTISKGRYNKTRRRILKNAGVVVAVHTVNSKSLLQKLFKRGASVVYTDFIY